MRAAILILSCCILVINLGSSATSSPVADSEKEYQIYGRVFPDPHGCHVGEPGYSPWSKGKVCAVDFIQFEELVKGLTLLENLYPNFVELYRLDQDFDCRGNHVAEPERACKQFRSAGLPITASGGGSFTRDRQPLYMLRITDESVSKANKEHFVFPLSVHGIERAGVEGGTRAAEDLATWAACERNRDRDVCAAEEPIPHPILETMPSKSITAGEALRRAAIYFVYPNPDGWMRGDRTTGTQFYQRYNGNGVDLNRDWPTQGFTFRPYTPWSEPETRAFGRVLRAVGPKDRRGRPRWTGGIDLHGQQVDRAFSFTMIGASERPYDKNQRVLQTVKGAWADAEKRLSWSPLIKPNDAASGDPRFYGVQWGTVWDTIDYTVTGSLGDWIDSPIGLNADGLDNEMSLSHVTNCGVGSCFDQQTEQLHVDGNKSLIYSMINYSLKREDTTFETRGRVAYVHKRGALRARGDRETIPPRFAKLPPQKAIEGLTLTPANDYTHEFRVKGPAQDVYNGGIAVTLTCANLQGVAPCGLSEARLERRDPVEESTQGEGNWETINTYFNQSAAYAQAGQALHGNLPRPGRYRVRIERGDASGVFNADVRFTREKAWPDPGQVGYSATNMQFWRDLQPFAEPGIERISARDVARKRGWRTRYDTIVVTNAVFPKLANKLRRWVWHFNGNLVLTDAALKMLEEMAILKKGSVSKSEQYAGYVNFATRRREVTYADPLARKINQPGAAEGQQGQELHRRQTYEPVPIGYAIENAEGASVSNAPVWHVDERSWANSRRGQRAVGTTGSLDAVSLGEINWGGGRIRILGAALPIPSGKFDHPFGLADYSLTYSGYQLMQNMLTWRRH